jgi:hypothetical protein
MMLWSAPRSSTSTLAEPVVLDIRRKVPSEEMVRPGERLISHDVGDDVPFKHLVVIDEGGL